MKTDHLFGANMNLLERSLNLRSRNQQLIVSNLANLDTPNYKAYKMVAADQGAAETHQGPRVTMTRTRSGHMAPASPASPDTVPVERVADNPHAMRGDGNTVELETEMSNLAENTLMYNTATRIVANKFNLLRSVIKGGS
jgi:flagellar basal-body rod protein FlgB